MGFDVAGNLLFAEDANGHIATNIYWANSNRVGATQDPLANLTSLAYDLAGQLLEFTNARNFVTSTTYDPVGRVQSVQNAVGATTTYPS